MILTFTLTLIQPVMFFFLSTLFHLLININYFLFRPAVYYAPTFLPLCNDPNFSSCIDDVIPANTSKGVQQCGYVMVPFLSFENSPHILYWGQVRTNGSSMFWMITVCFFFQNRGCTSIAKMVILFIGKVVTHCILTYLQMQLLLATSQNKQ